MGLGIILVCQPIFSTHPHTLSGLLSNCNNAPTKKALIFPLWCGSKQLIFFHLRVTHCKGKFVKSMGFPTHACCKITTWRKVFLFQFPSVLNVWLYDTVFIISSTGFHYMKVNSIQKRKSYKISHISLPRMTLKSMISATIIISIKIIITVLCFFNAGVLRFLCVLMQSQVYSYITWARYM